MLLLFNVINTEALASFVRTSIASTKATGESLS
jgi:hypothetical protein